MTVLIEKIRPLSAFPPAAFRPLQPANGFQHRLLTVAVMVIAIYFTPKGLELAASALSEAYTAVGVFVAATLAVIIIAERLMGGDLGRLLESHRHWQVPAGALLGALPGCGGAIVAVTQFTRGSMSFGGVVATLTSTMGDAIFLLLAREPQTALTILSISTVIGILMGYIVDTLHGQRFMQNADKPTVTSAYSKRINRPMSALEWTWLALMIPGLAIGVTAAFQIELDGILPAGEIGLAGAMLALIMWSWRGGDNRDCQNGACNPQPASAKVINDTNFVTAWVIFAFVGFELLIATSGVDLPELFNVWAPLVPLMAIIAGFIPGCGPQIIVTSMYLNGSIPFSAQLGNAISNDGDALFPAIAVAPRAALLATIYSAIPAVIAAYSWWWIFE
jgi:uncharacterized membrane protein